MAKSHSQFGSPSTCARIHPFPFLPFQDVTDLLKRGLCCGIVIFDPKGRVLMANETMAGILGEALDGLGELVLDPTRPKSVLSRLREGWLKARETMNPVDFHDVPLIRKDASHVMVSGRIMPLALKGVFKGMFLSAEDTTGYASIREQAERLSGMVDESPFGLLRVSSDGRIVYANAAASSLLKSQGLALGKNLAEPHLSALQTVIATGRSQEMLFTGPVCHIGICMAMGDSGYAIIHTHDISECKRAQEALVQTRDLLESQTELICRHDRDGVLIYANSSFCGYFGKKREGILGTRFLPDMPEADFRLRQELIQSLNPDKPVATLEHRVILEDGEERWQQWVTRAIYNSRGTLQSYQSVGRDITNRVLAEQSFRQVCQENMTLRRKLEAMFESITDAIITVDKDLRVIRTNRALDDLCSRAGSMQCDACLQDAFEPGQYPTCIDLLAHVVKTREAVRGVRAECNCGAKAMQVTMLNASPLFDENHRLAGAVLVIRDITRLDELEKRFEDRSMYRSIIGASKPMQNIYDTLERLSDIKTTVLITGESGTGKELIVEALHYSSSVITGPLVKVNCAALAESLLESELFGHVRGAFTGAVRDRVGRFQAAEGGTIFLDEIGDLPPSIQVKLLRVLERKEYERVGDSTTLKADVRVVAATNSDLADKVEKGLFREDLYYRLRVMVVNVPPLRDRRGDIPLLVNYFLEHYSKTFGKQLDGVTVEVMDTFMQYPWPGNIRELKHTIEHAAVLCQGGTVSLHLLPVELRRFAAESQGSADAVLERAQQGDADALEEALDRAHWNKAKAAKLLGISRTTLYRRLQEAGIDL